MGHVHEEDAPLLRLGQRSEEFRVARCIAGPIGPEDGRPQSGLGQLMPQGLCRQGRGEVHDGDVGIEVLIESRLAHRPEEEVAAEPHMDPHFGQCRKIRAHQGLEALGILLVGSVAPDELIPEVDDHLPDQRATLGVRRIPLGRDLDGGQQVFLAVRAEHPNGQLAAGEHHGFAEIGQHETEGTGRVGHGVGSMEHHKAIVTVPAQEEQAGQFAPPVGGHVAAVDGGQRLEIQLDFEGVDFGHPIAQVVEVQRLQGPRVRILHGSDGAPGVDEQDAAGRHGASGVKAGRRKSRSALAVVRAATSARGRSSRSATRWATSAV